MTPASPIIRALIVDDEPPARELIATLLRDEADVVVVGQCANGREAVAAIDHQAPDLVFLDVQMPGLDGFEVLAQARPKHPPQVVFVTAFEQHAIRAFEVHAFDYLLKPFEYDRLREVVQRVRQRLAEQQEGVTARKLSEFLDDPWQRAATWDRIAVRKGDRVIFIKPPEIDWIEAEGNYVRLHLGTQAHLLRETLQAAEHKLGGRNFLRVSRSALVNLERVKEWQPLFHGDSVLILHDGQRLTVSRTYRERLDELFSQLG